MCDWDRNFDGVVANDATPSALSVEASSKTRFSVSRVFASALVALGLASAGLVLTSAHDARGAVLNSFEVVESFVAGLSRPQMPDNLLIYDRAQFENFMLGVSRISDAELHTYVISTKNAHQTATDLMQPFFADALSLAHLELDRRGLPGGESITTRTDAPGSLAQRFAQN